MLGAQQKPRPLAGVVVGHPRFEVYVAHGQLRIVECRPLRVQDDSSLTTGQLAMRQRVEDAFGIQAQQRPAWKLAWLWHGTLLQRFQDALLETQ